MPTDEAVQGIYEALQECKQERDEARALAGRLALALQSRICTLPERRAIREYEEQSKSWGVPEGTTVGDGQ